MTCDTVAVSQHEPLTHPPGQFEVRRAKSETVLPFMVKIDSGSISFIMRHLIYWPCRMLGSTVVSHSPHWRSITNQTDNGSGSFPVAGKELRDISGGVVGGSVRDRNGRVVFRAEHNMGCTIPRVVRMIQGK